MAENNQGKITNKEPDVEVDPVLQGIDRVRDQRAENPGMDPTPEKESQDTQTRSNIHLGSQFAEGDGGVDGEGQPHPFPPTESTILGPMQVVLHGPSIVFL